MNPHAILRASVLAAALGLAGGATTRCASACSARRGCSGH